MLYYIAKTRLSGKVKVYIGINEQHNLRFIKMQFQFNLNGKKKSI